jgi:hypothetical protein
MSIEDKINKTNLDFYLKEFAKNFRKLNGNNLPAEIILVGGASVLTNYSFRQSTTDIDAVILASSVVQEVVNIVSAKYDLPGDWLNTDFKKTNSYSEKLREVSKHYKTFSNIVDIRTVSEEYLIAMKLMAGREYKHDMSDIVGIIWEQQKKRNPMTIDKIKKAVIELYGNWKNLPENSRKYLNRILKNNDYEKLYYEMKNEEKEAKQILNNFNEKYPNVITKENINKVVRVLLEKKELEVKEIIKPMKRT